MKTCEAQACFTPVRPLPNKIAQLEEVNEACITEGRIGNACRGVRDTALSQPYCSIGAGQRTIDHGRISTLS